MNGKLRIGIIGIGALASFFAARLDELADVVLVGSWQPQLAALATGLTLVHLDGRETQHQVTAVNDSTLIPPVDVVLVLLKSWQTAAAPARIAPILLPGGLVITLQNGLGNRETLAAALPERIVGQGVITLGATLLRPGVVRHAGEGSIYLAEPQPAHMLFVPLVTLLQRAGLAVQVSDNVDRLVWGKLAVNAAINPLTAVYRLTNGQLTTNTALRRLMSLAADEVTAVALAQGITLPFADAAAEALRVAINTFHNRSSMLQDVENGRATEIDAICGAVVQAGEQWGVPTPVNARLWRWVKEVERETKSGHEKENSNSQGNKISYRQ